MKRSIGFLVFLLLTIGCRTVSLEQRKIVGHFATKAENISGYPEKILTELAAIRETRGLYYAGSLLDVESHLTELDAIVKEGMNDDKLLKRATSSFKILGKYARGLTGLTARQTAKSRLKLSENLGSDLETLVGDFNGFQNKVQIPKGLGTLLAKLACDGTERLLAIREMQALRKYASQADTLVAVVCNEMVEFLSSQGVGQLIGQEETGVTESFRFYLTVRKISTVDSDREYVALKKRVEDVKMLQLKTISAVRDLRKAHHKIVESLLKRRSAAEMSSDLHDFYLEAEELQCLVDKLKIQ